MPEQRPELLNAEMSYWLETDRNPPEQMLCDFLQPFPRAVLFALVSALLDDSTADIADCVTTQF